MEKVQNIVNLVLKAVAVGMSIASIVMGFLPDVADVDTHVTLLGIGLFALAVAALQKEE
jgi:putative Mn2+ efflux pump MntP